MLHQHPSSSINCNFPFAIPGRHQSTRNRSQLSDDKDTRPFWPCDFFIASYRKLQAVVVLVRTHTDERRAAHNRDGYLRASLIRYLMLVGRERHRFIHSVVRSRGVFLPRTDKKSPRIILAWSVYAARELDHRRTDGECGSVLKSFPPANGFFPFVSLSRDSSPRFSIAVCPR